MISILKANENVSICVNVAFMLIWYDECIEDSEDYWISDRTMHLVDTSMGMYNEKMI